MAARKVRIVIFNNPDIFLGKLANWFTGTSDYHIGFTDGENFWDQGLLFRKRTWHPYDTDSITVFDCPVKVTAKELDQLVFAGVEKICIEKKFSNFYGLRDYIAFGLRKFGIPVKANFKGHTCGGIIRDVLFSHGWTHLGTDKDIEPSPAQIRFKFDELNIKTIEQGYIN